MNIITILYILGPLIALIYKILEYCNFWNFISGRDKALLALNKLKTPTGYPESFIYNRDGSAQEFQELLKRISKNTSREKISKALESGCIPSLLTTGGSPIILNGLPEEWEQEEKTYYSPNHPILMVFEEHKKGDVCCTLGELEKWIDDEKSRWNFWLGVVLISIFSIASILLALQLETSIAREGLFVLSCQ